MNPSSVFIVEDEAIIAEDLRHRVEAMGYTVSGTAATASEACDQIASLRPNLVLMDIVLKGEPSGIDAAREIRQRHDIPVVFLTSHSDSSTISAASSTQPLGYLLKPVDQNELRVTLQVALTRHSAEQRLRRAEHRLASTLRCVGDGLIATDRHGVITYLNPKAEELTGWRSDEALGRAFSDVVHLREGRGGVTAQSPVDQALARGTIVHIDRHTALVRRDGAEIFIDDSAAPIVDEAGDVVGSVVVFRDSTDRVQAEDDAEERARQREREIAERQNQLQHLSTHFSQFSGEVFSDLRLALAAMRRTSQVLVHTLRGQTDADVHRLAADLLEQSDQVYVAVGLFAAALESSAARFRSVL